ncbi:MAG: (2Fe-2S)-binding protein [Parvibaculaceae bacterium]
MNAKLPLPASPDLGGRTVEFYFDGELIKAAEGQSVAAAVMSVGRLDLRTSEAGDKRGMLCGIGVCWECRCVVDQIPNVRSCLLEAKQGMIVRSQVGLD